MPLLLLELFRRYGYAVIVTGVLLENAGVPAPGHTVVLAGGFLAQQGALALPLVFATGGVAAFCGGQLGFWLGRRYGRVLLVRYRGCLHLSEERQRRLEAYAERHYVKAILGGRFVFGVQTALALLMGMSSLSGRRYFIWNLIGAAVWSAAYSLVGYAFGSSWEVMRQWIDRSGLAALLLIIVFVSGSWILRRVAQRQLSSDLKEPK